MRVMVLGGLGLLGHRVARLLAAGHDVHATVRRPHRYAGEILPGVNLLTGVDVGDFDGVIRAVRLSRPDVIVNCVGVVKQRPEASDPLISIAVNSLLPHRLHELAGAAGARLIHISTDCVFSGHRGRYTEADPSDAEDLYGRSKYLGEVSAAGGITLRTSMIGREVTGATGLVEWFLGRSGQEVDGFTRAIYTGLTADELATVIERVISRHPDLTGVYHVGSEPISKYDLLMLLNDAFRSGVTVRPAERVRIDRSLNSSRFREATGWEPPSWRDMVDGMASDSDLYERWRSQ